MGSYDEPAEVGGLAHFCEHMMALGSKKYPNEGIYKDKAGKYGGKTNAFTANEATCYQFVIMAELNNFKIIIFYVFKMFDISFFQRVVNSVFTLFTVQLLKPNYPIEFLDCSK